MNNTLVETSPLPRQGSTSYCWSIEAGFHCTGMPKTPAAGRHCNSQV